MLLKKEKIKRHNVHQIRLSAWLDAISYRIRRPVVQIRVYHGSEAYPMCPRCRICLDREYMGFCDRCGQHLGWKIYPMTKIRHATKRMDDVANLLRTENTSQSFKTNIQIKVGNSEGFATRTNQNKLK